WPGFEAGLKWYTFTTGPLYSIEDSAVAAFECEMNAAPGLTTAATLMSCLAIWVTLFESKQMLASNGTAALRVFSTTPEKLAVLLSAVITPLVPIWVAQVASVARKIRAAVAPAAAAVRNAEKSSPLTMVSAVPVAGSHAATPADSFI